MNLNRVKLGRAATFIKYLACVVSLIFLSKTLEQNHVSDIKFAESSRAAGKWAYEWHLQKVYQYSFFYPIYYSSS